MKNITNDNLWMIVPSALNKHMAGGTKPKKWSPTPGIPVPKSKKAPYQDEELEEESAEAEAEEEEVTKKAPYQAAKKAPYQDEDGSEEEEEESAELEGEELEEEEIAKRRTTEDYSEEYQMGYDGGYEAGYNSGYVNALEELGEGKFTKDKNDKVNDSGEGKRNSPPATEEEGAELEGEEEEEEEAATPVRKKSGKKPYKSKYMELEEGSEEEEAAEDAEEKTCPKCGGKPCRCKKSAKQDEDGAEEDAEEDAEEEEEDTSNRPKKKMAPKKKSRRLPVKRMAKAIKKMFGVNDEFDVKPRGGYYSQDGICIISMGGVLGKEVDTDANPGMINIDDISYLLKQANSDASIKTIILDIDSPGGQVTGIEELGNLIKSIGKVKPVYAFTDTICGSAAYWIASCCNGFGATVSSEVGSIGVFSLVEDHSARLKNEGIKVNAFFGGALKLLGMPFKPMEDSEKKWVQVGVDNQYAKFKATVNENRGGVKDENMQGQVFTADEALAANLIDVVVADLSEFISTIDTNK